MYGAPNRGQTDPMASAHSAPNASPNEIYIRGNLVLLKLSRCDVDHINGDGTDNRMINLRVCARQQNIFNQSKRAR